MISTQDSGRSFGPVKIVNYVYGPEVGNTPVSERDLRKHEKYLEERVAEASAKFFTDKDLSVLEKHEYYLQLQDLFVVRDVVARGSALGRSMVFIAQNTMNIETISSWTHSAVLTRDRFMETHADFEGIAPLDHNVDMFRREVANKVVYYQRVIDILHEIGMLRLPLGFAGRLGNG